MKYSNWIVYGVFFYNFSHLYIDLCENVIFWFWYVNLVKGKKMKRYCDSDFLWDSLIFLIQKSISFLTFSSYSNVKSCFKQKQELVNI